MKATLLHPGPPQCSEGVTGVVLAPGEIRGTRQISHSFLSWQTSRSFLSFLPLVSWVAMVSPLSLKTTISFRPDRSSHSRCSLLNQCLPLNDQDSHVPPFSPFVPGSPRAPSLTSSSLWTCWSLLSLRAYCSHVSFRTSITDRALWTDITFVAWIARIDLSLPSCHVFLEVPFSPSFPCTPVSPLSPFWARLERTVSLVVSHFCCSSMRAYSFFSISSFSASARISVAV